MNAMKHKRLTRYQISRGAKILIALSLLFLLFSISQFMAAATPSYRDHAAEFASGVDAVADMMEEYAKLEGELRPLLAARRVVRSEYVLLVSPGCGLPEKVECEIYLQGTDGQRAQLGELVRNSNLRSIERLRQFSRKILEIHEASDQSLLDQKNLAVLASIKEVTDSKEDAPDFFKAPFSYLKGIFSSAFLVYIKRERQKVFLETLRESQRPFGELNDVALRQTKLLIDSSILLLSNEIKNQVTSIAKLKSSQIVDVEKIDIETKRLFSNYARLIAIQDSLPDDVFSEMKRAYVSLLHGVENSSFRNRSLIEMQAFSRTSAAHRRSVQLARLRS